MTNRSKFVKGNKPKNHHRCRYKSMILEIRESIFSGASNKFVLDDIKEIVELDDRY